MILKLSFKGHVETCWMNKWIRRIPGRGIINYVRRKMGNTIGNVQEVKIVWYMLRSKCL